MNEEKGNIKKPALSRRDFLKDAGLIVGGATIGSMALINACAGNATATVTVPGGTSTTTATKTVTSTTTVAGPGGSVVTVTQPGPTVTQETQATPSDIVSLTVNDKDYKVQVQPHWPLSFVLRDRLGLFGTKVGCETGQCASCTVLADGVPVLSCLLLAMDAAGKKITTVEGLSDGITLNPLQQKFYDQEAFQCGFCTPGILMASTALLASNPKPTIDDVREALGGHVCACTNFTKVVNAVTGGV